MRRRDEGEGILSPVIFFDPVTVKKRRKPPIQVHGAVKRGTEMQKHTVAGRIDAPGGEESAMGTLAGHHRDTRRKPPSKPVAVESSVTGT